VTTLPDTPEPLVRLAAVGVAAALMVTVLPLMVKTSPSANFVVAAVDSAPDAPSMKVPAEIEKRRAGGIVGHSRAGHGSRGATERRGSDAAVAPPAVPV